MNDTLPTDDAKTNLAVRAETAVSKELGGLAFKNMGEIIEFSKLMSMSGQAVPKHLRSQPGACLAVSTQALNWRMDPFAVANKSYAVNDRIAYEAQLIQAVIEQRAPIKGRIKGKFEGEGAKRRCILTVISEEDGDEIEYASPEIGQIKVKNSPLWQADPDQQLWYYSARAMCRRHFPDVLLGVYEKEEIEYGEGMRDVTPPMPEQTASERLRARRDAGADALGYPKPEAEDAAPEASGEAGEAVDAEIVEDEDETAGAFPDSEAWDQGMAAFQGKVPRAKCPYDDGQDRADWLGGFDGAAKAADSGDDK